MIYMNISIKLYMQKKLSFCANKSKIHQNWHYINSKVQLARESPEMTRGCKTHVEQ